MKREEREKLIEIYKSEVRETGCQYGIVVPNYRSLCSLFGMIPKGGNDKKKQLRELGEVIIFEKSDKGNSYILSGIRGEEEDGEKKVRRKTKYVDDIYKLLLLYVARCGRKISDDNEESGNNVKIRFEYHAYLQYRLFGLTNAEYFKEYIHLSKNTLATKTDFFYRHQIESKLVIKEFKRAIKNGRFPEEFTNGLSEGKYLSRLIIPEGEENGKRTIIMDDKREEFNQEDRDEREGKKKKLLEWAQQYYPQEELNSEQIVNWAGWRGDLDFPNWIKRYGVEKETTAMTLAQEQTIKEIVNRVCREMGVANRLEAKYNGTLKTYDRKLRRALENEVGYSKCETSHIIYVGEAWLYEELQRLTGLDMSEGGTLIDEEEKNNKLDEYIIQVTKHINETFITSLLKHQGRWAAKVNTWHPAGRKDDKDDKGGDGDEEEALISQIKEAMSTTYRQTSYIDILDAFCTRYVKISDRDVRVFLGQLRALNAQ